MSLCSYSMVDVIYILINWKLMHSIYGICILDFITATAFYLESSLVQRRYYNLKFYLVVWVLSRQQQHFIYMHIRLLNAHLDCVAQNFKLKHINLVTSIQMWWRLLRCSDDVCYTWLSIVYVYAMNWMEIEKNYFKHFK